MKRCCVIILLLMLILPGKSYAQPDIDGEILGTQEQMKLGVQQQVDHLDMRDWDRFLKELEEQQNPVLKQMSAKEILKKLVTGDYNIDLKQFWIYLGGIFYKEILNNLGWVTKIIVMAVICGVLKNMQASFQNSSIAEVAHFVCYIVVILLIIQSLMSILDTGKQAIEKMISFMQIILPTLLALLVAVGGITSSTILQPTIGFMLGIIGTFLKNAVFPLILLSTIIILINHISNKVQLDGLSKLLKNLCGWILGIVFTVFVGILVVQGVMTASVDGISIRTAKYAVDTFVPIVGGLFAQAIDMVVGCSLLIKNAVGLLGLIIIGFICLCPTLKILCMMFIYKLSSAILEPVSDKRIVDCLNDIGSILTILAITVVGVAIMFFMVITLIIGIGNVATMMR